MARISTKRLADDAPSWAVRLVRRMEQLGWDMAELSRRSGVSYDSVNKYCRGDVDKPRGRTLHQIADALNVRLIWLEHGEGPILKRIPIVGYVSGGEEWVPYDDYAQGGGLDAVDVDLSEDAIGLRVRGRSMSPVYRDGDILVAERTPDPSRFLQQDCIVQTETGATYVKTVLRGSSGDVYRLRSYNPDYSDIEDVRLSWAAPIKWIKRGA